jgi:hypothetical protein
VVYRYTLIPAGPQLTNGCFQMRAWAGEVSRHSRAAGWRAQVGGQGPGHHRQKTGMGHLEQQTDWLQVCSWVGKGRNQNAHQQTQYRVLQILIRVYLRELLDPRDKTIRLPRVRVK